MTELLSIALASEREAIRRYAELAATMHACGNSETGTLFEQLVSEEQAHEQQLIEWAGLQGLAGDLVQDQKPPEWKDPGVATVYDVEAVDPQLSTPYKALAFAVHNEERGFRFYSYIAANSNDVDVCETAEILAREELAHAAQLRGHRRRAWHAQRGRQDIEPPIDSGMIHHEADLLAATLCTEHAITVFLENTGSKHPALQVLLGSTREIVSTSEDALGNNGSPGANLAATLQAISSWRERQQPMIENTTDALKQLAVLCDRSFAFYDSVVAATDDEAVMLQAQHNAVLALQRIEELRRITLG